MEDPNSKIDVVYNQFKNAVIKMNLKNNLSFIDLFMSNSIDKINKNIGENILSKEDLKEIKLNKENKSLNNISHLAFDYYILKKNESKKLFIYNIRPHNKFLL